MKKAKEKYPIPDWLYIGRAVRCCHGVEPAFEGEGLIRQHADPGSVMNGCVFVRYEGGEGWYAPDELTPSGCSSPPQGNGDR